MLYATPACIFSLMPVATGLSVLHSFEELREFTRLNGDSYVDQTVADYVIKHTEGHTLAHIGSDLQAFMDRANANKVCLLREYELEFMDGSQSGLDTDIEGRSITERQLTQCGYMGGCSSSSFCRRQDSRCTTCSVYIIPGSNTLVYYCY